MSLQADMMSLQVDMMSLHVHVDHIQCMYCHIFSCLIHVGVGSCSCADDVVAVYLVVLPLALSPDQRVVIVIAFVALLLGIPVFFIFSWDRLRPKVFNKISGTLCVLICFVIRGQLISSCPEHVHVHVHIHVHEHVHVHVCHIVISWV